MHVAIHGGVRSVFWDEKKKTKQNQWAGRRSFWKVISYNVIRGVCFSLFFLVKDLS